VHTAVAAGARASRGKIPRPSALVTKGVTSARAVKNSSRTVIALLVGRDGGQGPLRALRRDGRKHPRLEGTYEREASLPVAKVYGRDGPGSDRFSVSAA